MHSAFQRVFAKIQNGLSWRLRGLFGDRVVDLPKVKTAHVWRPFLKGTQFIGITGSAGKTTTKELLVGLLSARHRTIGTSESLNVPAELAGLVLRTDRQHAFCVAELSAGSAGSLDAPLALLRPNIGIVTAIGDDHLSAYQSREAIAREKGKLVAALPSQGVAVLNADDPLVLGMAGNCKAKVLTYGMAPQADVRATDLQAAWPHRLTLTASYGGERVVVRSQLCGTHLRTPLLAALAGGIAAGLTLRESAEGLERVAPFVGRMQPVESTHGVTFMRDDFKAPLWTVDACFDFMRTAQARRKIIVIGMLSDCGTSLEKKYIDVAKRAQEIADITVFVGPFASHVLKARRPDRKSALHAFSHTREATQFINAMTQVGDLVLLKGTTKQEHLERIILDRTGDIACWRNECLRNIFCSNCPDKNNPSHRLAAQSAEVGTPQERTEDLPSSVLPALDPQEQVIVGLGNPGVQYVDTPHNAGYAVVDRIAASQNLVWESHPNGWMAKSTTSVPPFRLVKINLPMNHLGIGLKQLADELGFDADKCILVFDDLEMQIGMVRARHRGGAAGHRGVLSILEAFQTDEFRRVKLGVKPTDDQVNRIEYVITPFAQSERDAVREAVAAAATRTLEMMLPPKGRKSGPKPAPGKKSTPMHEPTT
jgi:UDP-N-acetylmuramoyl-tripeptide--D-alanyl-D-alanine ligase